MPGHTVPVAVHDVRTAAALPERGKRTGHAVPIAAVSREQRERVVRVVRVAAAPPEFSPSPLPQPPCNGVTPVVMRPIIATNNQPGRGTGEGGDKD